MILALPAIRIPRRVGVALAVSVIVAGVAPAAAAAPVAGSAGTDTSLPATDSQATVSGRGGFANLKVTVNQTRNLAAQAVSVTWTGGTPTPSPGETLYRDNYLQMMQCWGDDDGTVPGNPGPPPEQCVFGGTQERPDPGSTAAGSEAPRVDGRASSRVISHRDWPNFAATPGYLDKRDGMVWKPFRPVGGEDPVLVMTDPTSNSTAYWRNPFFGRITTNEIVAAVTGPGGKGAEIFRTDTGIESRGLGCGTPVERVAGGTPRIPKCWLVVVPRGGHAEENIGANTGFFERGGDRVVTSPLAPRAWQNRISVPLEFNPVASSCRLVDTQRRIAGTDLAVGAVSSWQPKLCATPGNPPYAYASVGDSSARRQLVGKAPGSPGMIVVPRPLEAPAVSPADPVTYAPLSLSAIVIGFNVERDPPLDAGAAMNALRGVRVAEINLTPRLVAKLLTQSYRTQVEVGPSTPRYDTGKEYDWVKKNPVHMRLDPDFLRFNPEFNLMQIVHLKNFGGLLLPRGSSDAALQVWEYVLADPEARAWLDGTPDPWGMKVNPVYATTAGANAPDAFGGSVPDSFPKADPYCFQAPPLKNGVVPPPLCGTEWLPYTGSPLDSARRTRVADDKTPFLKADALTSSEVYNKPDGFQPPGSRAILSLTDSASAALFGVQMARLSRAGDNGADRRFIAPDAAGISAGVESMAPRGEPAVLEPAPTAPAPAAYPLTALTYAAVTPLSLDDQARKEYAAFVEYAAGPGQESGFELGKLPPGYVPLPAPLRARATAAAKTIRELRPPAGPGDAAPSDAAPGQSSPAAGNTSTASPGSSGSGSGSGSSAAGGGGPAAAGAATGATKAAAGTTAPPTTTSRITMPLTRALTPVVALARNRFVLPGLVVIALLSALGSLEASRRARWSTNLVRRRNEPRRETTLTEGP